MSNRCHLQCNKENLTWLSKTIDPDKADIKPLVGSYRQYRHILNFFTLSKIDHAACLERSSHGIRVIASCTHSILQDSRGNGSAHGLAQGCKCRRIGEPCQCLRARSCTASVRLMHRVLSKPVYVRKMLLLAGLE